MEVTIKEPHGNPKELTQDDVWGKWDENNFQMISKGMIVARGLPTIDPSFPLAEHDRIVKKTYPTFCPVWKEELPYKSVTAICNADQVDQVSYWLEYVLGGGAIHGIEDQPDGKVAIRADYMCW